MSNCLNWCILFDIRKFCFANVTFKHIGYKFVVI